MTGSGTSRLRAFAARLLGLVRRSHDDKQFDQEIHEHLRLLAERFVAQGLSPDAAAVAARRQFGSTAVLREERWTLQTLPSIESLWQDVRYALRMLRGNPGFALVAICTLGLGVGANTAIFSLVNAVILQPLDYPKPEQLQFLTTRSGAVDDAEGLVSPAEYWELAEISQSFSALGAFALGEVNLAARDQPRRVTRATVDAGLFEALAIPSEYGRWFRPEDTRAGGPAVVVLSHDLWTSNFGARSDMVGQTIEVDGVMREVVGIMPDGFDLLDRHVELWLPLQLAPTIRQYRSSHFLSVVGRLKEDVTPADADAELASLVSSWGARVGASGHVFSPGEHVLQMKPLQAEVVGSARRVLWVLQAAVGLVLVVACVNLANLLLARAGSRQREIAARLALGATRSRLVAQFTAEGIVLSLFGAAVGLGVAWAGIRTLNVAFPDALPRVVDVPLDASVLVVSGGISILIGIAFGFVPLLDVASTRVGQPLTNGGGRGATSARRVHGGLVAAEVALAVVLAVGAGLMLRTVANLVHVDTGFERSRLVTFGIALPTGVYSTFDRQVQAYARLIDRLAATPGVDRVAIMSGLPPQRQANGFGTDVDDHTPRRDVLDAVDYYQTVSVGYFEAMQIPVVRGRPFRDADATGSPVAVVNETFARTFWSGLDPIGRRVRPRFGNETPWATVVGVVKDVRQGGVDRPTGTEIYFLLEQLPRIFTTFRILGAITESGIMHVVARSDLPLATLRPTVTSTVRQIDPALPVIGLQTMDDVFDHSLRRPRLLMHLFGVFAALAVVLTAIGAYGVLSYLVTQRRREIGIRMALGASRQAILGAVIAPGLMLTGIGLAAGLSAAIVSTRLMKTWLFDVSPGDPATLAGVAALISIVAGAASLIPALRATRIDPIVALRDE